MNTGLIARDLGESSNSRDFSSSQERLHWIDSARGIGIVLVVVGHALNGLLADGRSGNNYILLAAFQAIYSFHMPLFFFLSGIFIAERISISSKMFISQSFRRLMYPYFLWGIIQLIIILLATKLVNHPQPHDIMLFVEIIWHPPSQFWFLYALFIMQLLALTFDIFSNYKTMIVVSTAAYIITAIFSLPTLVYFVLHFWIYYSVSVVYSSLIKERGFLSFSPLYLVVVSLLWAILVFLGARSDAYQTIVAVPAAALGIIITIRIAKMPTICGNIFVRYIGKRSLPIFLQHVIVVAGTRIILLNLLHISNPFVILIISSLLGVTIPCLTYEIARKIGVSKLAGFE